MSGWGTMATHQPHRKRYVSWRTIASGAHQPDRRRDADRHGMAAAGQPIAIG
jgi:hypothetical protein